MRKMEQFVSKDKWWFAALVCYYYYHEVLSIVDLCLFCEIIGKVCSISVFQANAVQFTSGCECLERYIDLLFCNLNFQQRKFLEAQAFYEQFALQGLVPPVDPMRLAEHDLYIKLNFLSFPSQTCSVVVVDSIESINCMARVLGFLESVDNTQPSLTKSIGMVTIEEVTAIALKNCPKFTTVSSIIAESTQCTSFPKTSVSKSQGFLMSRIASDDHKFRNVIGLDTEWKTTRYGSNTGADILQVSKIAIA
jgi:hypothetical protein